MIPARLFLIVFFLFASVSLAPAQPDGINGANAAATPDYDWNAFFDRLSRRTTAGPLTDFLKRGPLLVETDPLGVTGRKTLKVTPPPNSFIEPAGSDVLRRRRQPTRRCPRLTAIAGRGRLVLDVRPEAVRLADVARNIPFPHPGRPRSKRGTSCSAVKSAPPAVGAPIAKYATGS
jgi:hypothetical protein